MVRLTGVWLPILSFAARLPSGICPTGTLLMVTALRGIGPAGVVAGMLWAGQAVGGPLLGRTADRRGHRPVLLAASLANAAAIAALAVSATRGAPVAVVAAFAAAAGLTGPQIGPLSRTRWVALAKDRPADGARLVARALALDTTLDELGFLIGPALAGVLAVAVAPAAGLVVAAALIGVGGVAFGLHPTAPGPTVPGPTAVEPVERAASSAPGPRRPRLLTPSLLALFALTSLQGCVLGSGNAGVNALAEQSGRVGMAGVVWSAMAVTSTAVGMASTARPGPLDLTVRLRVALVGQLAMAVPLLVVHGLAAVAVVLAGFGFAVAPHLIAVFSLAERVAPRTRMAEAMTLLNTGLIAGQGLAAVIAGRLAQEFGPRAAFGCAVGWAALAAGFAAVTARQKRYARRAEAPAVVTAAAPGAACAGQPAHGDGPPAGRY